MTSRSADLRRSALLFAIPFLQALDNQLVPVLLPVFREELPGAPMGYLLTAYALACGIIPFCATARSGADHLKAVSISALVVLGGAALLFAATGSFPVRVAARAAAGGASGVLSMTLLLSAARAEDETARARQFTLITAGQLAALVAGVPIVAWMTKSLGIPTLYRAMGAAVLLLVIPFAAMAERKAPPGTARPRSFITLFTHRQGALILVATGLVGVAMAGPVGYLSSFLKGVRKLEIDAIGAVYMWAGIGPLLAMPFAGRVIARWKPYRVAIVGSLVIAAPIVLFPHVAISLATAAAVMFVCVFIETIRRAALQGSLSDAVPPSDLPRYLAFRGVILQLGFAIGYALAELEFGDGGFELVCRIAAILSVSAAAVLMAAGAPANRGTVPDGAA